MKLTNYHKNNYSIDKDGTIYRGDITMSIHEYDACIQDIKNNDLLNRQIKSITNNIKSLGITNTRFIVDKYKLPRYKNINYLIIIK